MALINQELMGVQPSPQSMGGSENFINQLTEFLNAINKILENPALAGRLGSLGGSKPLNNVPEIQDSPVAKQLPQPETFSQENFLKYLSTADGKKNIISGLENIKNSMGDLTISQIILYLKNLS